METYNKKQVAALLGVSISTVDHMRLDGRLPAPLPRRSLDTSKSPWLWDKAAIDEIKATN